MINRRKPGPGFRVTPVSATSGWSQPSVRLRIGGAQHPPRSRWRGFWHRGPGLFLFPGPPIEENAGAVHMQMTADDLNEIGAILASLPVYGAPCGEGGMKLVGRQARIDIRGS